MLLTDLPYRPNSALTLSSDRGGWDRGMGEQPAALLSGVAVALSGYMTSQRQSSGHVRLKPPRKADDLLVLDGEAVVDLLRATIEREGSQTAFAKHHRINRAYVNMVLNGKKPVGDAIAEALGLHKVWSGPRE
jgi:hypothetical protein